MQKATKKTELEQAEFFRCLTSEHLAEIRHAVLEKRFERQKVIFFEDSPAEYLWVVRSGEVRLYKSSASGRITFIAMRRFKSRSATR